MSESGLTFIVCSTKLGLWVLGSRWKLVEYRCTDGRDDYISEATPDIRQSRLWSSVMYLGRETEATTPKASDSEKLLNRFIRVIKVRPSYLERD